MSITYCDLKNKNHVYHFKKNIFTSENLIKCENVDYKEYKKLLKHKNSDTNSRINSWSVELILSNNKIKRINSSDSEFLDVKKRQNTPYVKIHLKKNHLIKGNINSFSSRSQSEPHSEPIILPNPKPKPSSKHTSSKIETGEKSSETDPEPGSNSSINSSNPKPKPSSKHTSSKIETGEKSSETDPDPSSNSSINSSTPKPKPSSKHTNSKIETGKRSSEPNPEPGSNSSINPPNSRHSGDHTNSSKSIKMTHLSSMKLTGHRSLSSSYHISELDSYSATSTNSKRTNKSDKSKRLKKYFPEYANNMSSNNNGLSLINNSDDDSNFIHKHTTKPDITVTTDTSDQLIGIMESNTISNPNNYFIQYNPKYAGSLPDDFRPSFGDDLTPDKSSKSAKNLNINILNFRPNNCNCKCNCHRGNNQITDNINIAKDLSDHENSMTNMEKGKKKHKQKRKKSMIINDSKHGGKNTIYPYKNHTAGGLGDDGDVDSDNSVTLKKKRSNSLIGGTTNNFGVGNKEKKDTKKDIVDKKKQQDVDNKQKIEHDLKKNSNSNNLLKENKNKQSKNKSKSGDKFNALIAPNIEKSKNQITTKEPVIPIENNNTNITKTPEKQSNFFSLNNSMLIPLHSNTVVKQTELLKDSPHLLLSIYDNNTYKNFKESVWNQSKQLKSINNFNEKVCNRQHDSIKRYYAHLPPVTSVIRSINKGINKNRLDTLLNNLSSKLGTLNQQNNIFNNKKANKKEKFNNNNYIEDTVADAKNLLSIHWQCKSIVANALNEYSNSSDAVDTGSEKTKNLKALGKKTLCYSGKIKNQLDLIPSKLLSITNGRYKRNTVQDLQTCKASIECLFGYNNNLITAQLKETDNSTENICNVNKTTDLAQKFRSKCEQLNKENKPTTKKTKKNKKTKKK